MSWVKKAIAPIKTKYEDSQQVPWYRVAVLPEGSSTFHSASPNSKAVVTSHRIVCLQTPNAALSSTAMLDAQCDLLIVLRLLL